MSLDNFRELDIDYIWMDGEFVDWDSAHVHVLSHGLNYGSGVFEGLRCYDTARGPAIFRHRDHYERMADSAELLGMEMPYSVEELMDASRELIRRNELDECVLRPSMFYGYSTLGVHPGDNPVRSVIPAWPRPAYLGEEGLRKGVEVTISPWRRIHPSQVPSSAKATGVYLNSMIAKQDAVSKGYDEAIMLDMDGHVAEGTGETVFLVDDGSLYTPSLDSSILPGITRRTIVRLASDLGYDVVEKRVTTGELLTADELFFCGTAAEVTPIRKVDDTVIGTRGPVTEEIQSAYFDVVHGRREGYRDLLDPVRE